MRQRLTRAWFGEGAAAWPAARLGRWPLPSGGPEAIECAAAARSSCQEAAVRVFGPVPRRHDGHAAGRGRGSAVLWWGSSCLEAAVSPGPSVSSVPSASLPAVYCENTHVGSMPKWNRRLVSDRSGLAAASLHVARLRRVRCRVARCRAHRSGLDHIGETKESARVDAALPACCCNQ